MARSRSLFQAALECWEANILQILALVKAILHGWLPSLRDISLSKTNFNRSRRGRHPSLHATGKRRKFCCLRECRATKGQIQSIAFELFGRISESLFKTRLFCRGTSSRTLETHPEGAPGLYGTRNI